MEELQLLFAENSLHDRLLPLVPHLGGIGEELAEQLGRLFGLENKDDKDDHGCARAQGVVKIGLFGMLLSRSSRWVFSLSNEDNHEL